MNNRIVLIDKDGKEKECEMVALFNNPNFNSHYIAYTDGSKTDGKLDILVSKYREIDNKFQLEEITNEEEWKFVDEFIANEVFGDDDL